jgi:cytidine deaminase
LISGSDQIYTGACLGGEFGICAEQSAVSQLVSKEMPIIKKIVAVWRDEEGVLHALPPCGRCRDLMLRISGENLETEVILGKDHVSKLSRLLPFSYWHAEPL